MGYYTKLVAGFPRNRTSLPNYLTKSYSSFNLFLCAKKYFIVEFPFRNSMPEQEELFFIQDLETLRTISDPLRWQIIELLVYDPLTVKQTAARLGLAASRLYYHFTQLEKAGVITVVETRMVANLQEKLYQAVARNFTLAQHLLALDPADENDPLRAMAISTLDTTRDDLLRSLQARALELGQGAEQRPRRAILTRQAAFVTQQQADNFLSRLEALIKEFEGLESETPRPQDSELYALTVTFYPSFYFPEGEGDGDSV